MITIHPGVIGDLQNLLEEQMKILRSMQAIPQEMVADPIPRSFTRGDTTPTPTHPGQEVSRTANKKTKEPVEFVDLEPPMPGGKILAMGQVAGGPVGSNKAPNPGASDFTSGCSSMTRNCLAAVALVKKGQWTVARMEEWLNLCLLNKPHVLQSFIDEIEGVKAGFIHLSASDGQPTRWANNRPIIYDTEQEAHAVQARDMIAFWKQVEEGSCDPYDDPSPDDIVPCNVHADGAITTEHDEWSAEKIAVMSPENEG